MAAVSLITDSLMAAAAGTSQTGGQEWTCSSDEATEILFPAFVFEMNNTGPLLGNTLGQK